MFKRRAGFVKTIAVEATRGIRELCSGCLARRHPDSGAAPYLNATSLLGCALIMLALLAFPASPVRRVYAASGQQTVAIPSYFSDGALWNQLDGASPTVGVAVINPSNGPAASSMDCSTADPTYVSQVKTSQNAGVTVLGYVHTAWGGRPIADLKAEVDAYYACFHVDGIFFDEVATDCSLVGSYYQPLYAYVRAESGSHHVVALNPGTFPLDPCYMTASDILVTFEGSYTDYTGGYSQPAWVGSYPANRFWHLVYDTPTVQKMRNADNLSKTRNAGYVYVTDDDLPNPWDALPSDPYWTDELNLASEKNLLTMYCNNYMHLQGDPAQWPTTFEYHIGDPPNPPTITGAGSCTPGADLSQKWGSAVGPHTLTAANGTLSASGDYIFGPPVDGTMTIWTLAPLLACRRCPGFDGDKLVYGERAKFLLQLLGEKTRTPISGRKVQVTLAGGRSRQGCTTKRTGASGKAFCVMHVTEAKGHATLTIAFAGDGKKRHYRYAPYSASYQVMIR